MGQKESHCLKKSNKNSFLQFATNNEEGKRGKRCFGVTNKTPCIAETWRWQHHAMVRLEHRVDEVECRAILEENLLADAEVLRLMVIFTIQPEFQWQGLHILDSCVACPVKVQTETKLRLANHENYYLIWTILSHFAKWNGCTWESHTGKELHQYLQWKYRRKKLRITKCHISHIFINKTMMQYFILVCYIHLQ